jgi:hypothetical protein
MMTASDGCATTTVRTLQKRRARIQTSNCCSSRTSMVTVRGRQELPYLGHMLTYRAYGLQQFLLGAFEFLAPVLQLDRVNCTRPGSSGLKPD